MKERAQFNVRIGKHLKRQVALDHANTSTTKDIIAEVALENWFTRFSADQRSRFYHNHNRKAYQRAA